VRAATGFTFAAPAEVPTTAAPTPAELAHLRGPVCDEMLETYPDFCARVFDRKAAAA
jgi:glutaconate CoA-transferase subunit B